MVFKKINIKKKQFHVFSSEKTLLITLVASVLAHLLIIYTVPAVDIFSQGIGSISSDEMIVVDFIQEEENMGQIPVIDNQFLAANPEDSPADELQPQEEEINAAELPMPRMVEKDLEMDSQYALLADPDSLDPEFELYKRSVEKQDPPNPQEDLPKAEKPPVKEDLQLEPLDRQEQETRDPEQVQKNLLDNPSTFPDPVKDLERPQLALSPLDSSEPRLQVRKRQITEAERDSLTSSLFEPSSENAKRKLVGLDKTTEDEQNRFGIFAGEVFDRPGIDENARDRLASEESLPESRTEAREMVDTSLNLNAEIEGPVKGRKIVYQPLPPDVEEIENEVEFKLKFWVLPDGTIGEVIPLKRGDTRLEQIAIRYLKKWQFEPLPPGVPQQQIWGTIPIKFTLQ